MIALLVVVAAIAALTWLVGWWGVPVVAAIAGVLLWRRPAIAWLVALAAVVAWSALMLADATRGRFAALSAAVGGTLRVPASALVAVSLLFAALLAWSAAALGAEVARVGRRTPE